LASYAHGGAHDLVADAARVVGCSLVKMVSILALTW
jgi:hypothetical protein